MSDPRRYSISILENYSEKPLHEIALAVTKKIEKEITPDDFTLEYVEDLEVGKNFLTTEEPYTWRNVVEDLAPAFRDFPDTCFCLSVSDGEDGGQYRTLFFNGKAVTQYPEILYPEFRLNDFEYETSEKIPLGRAEKEVTPFQPKKGFEDRLQKFAVEWDKTIDKVLNEPDPVTMDLIKKSLFGLEEAYNTTKGVDFNA